MHLSSNFHPSMKMHSLRDIQICLGLLLVSLLFSCQSSQKFSPCFSDIGEFSNSLLVLSNNHIPAIKIPLFSSSLTILQILYPEKSNSIDRNSGSSHRSHESMAELRKLGLLLRECLIYPLKTLNNFKYTIILL